jgi:iron complex transport system substrate-binding protein
MAGGESYTAQAIRDAGGDYLWADVPGSGAIPLDTERVFLKAAHADIWINPSFYRSLRELYGADQRFQKFRAGQTGHVFNNTKQRTASGGNSIWERGIVHPDDVLADLIKVFHPERMPDWEFIYYEQLK